MPWGYPWVPNSTHSARCLRAPFRNEISHPSLPLSAAPGPAGAQLGVVAREGPKSPQPGCGRACGAGQLA